MEKTNVEIKNENIKMTKIQENMLGNIIRIKSLNIDAYKVNGKIIIEASFFTCCDEKANKSTIMAMYKKGIIDFPINDLDEEPPVEEIETLNKRIRNINCKIANSKLEKFKMNSFEKNVRTAIKEAPPENVLVIVNLEKYTYRHIDRIKKDNLLPMPGFSGAFFK
jgi:hypothetical protein